MGAAGPLLQPVAKSTASADTIGATDFLIVTSIADGRSWQAPRRRLEQKPCADRMQSPALPDLGQNHQSVVWTRASVGRE